MTHTSGHARTRLVEHEPSTRGTRSYGAGDLPLPRAAGQVQIQTPPGLSAIEQAPGAHGPVALNSRRSGPHVGPLGRSTLEGGPTTERELLEASSVGARAEAAGAECSASKPRDEDDG